MDGQCALSTSTILSQLPGLNVARTHYPKKLMDQFGQAPLMSTQSLYEYDDDDKTKALKAYDPDAARENFAQLKARQAAEKKTN